MTSDRPLPLTIGVRLSTGAHCLLPVLLSAVCLAAETGEVVSQGAGGGQGDGGVVVEPEKEGVGVEEEVLGPLRVWHIVFLVGLLVVVIVTVVCCCVDWRIPRTRQEIEETYQRRKINQKYLHQLERTPDVILRQGNNGTSGSNVDVNTEHEHSARTARQQGTPNNNYDDNIASHHEQRQRYQRPPQRHHHQGKHHDDTATTPKTTSGTGQTRVSVTDASARLARVAKSQMYGVQTPFTLGAITALQKQKAGRRPHDLQPP